MTTPQLASVEALSTAINAIDSVIIAFDSVKKRLIDVECLIEFPQCGSDDTALLALLNMSLADDIRRSATIGFDLPVPEPARLIRSESRTRESRSTEAVAPVVEKAFKILAIIYWYASDAMLQLGFAMESESDSVHESDSGGRSTMVPDVDDDDDNDDSSDLLALSRSTKIESVVKTIRNAIFKLDLAARRLVLVSQKTATGSTSRERLAPVPCSPGASSAPISLTALSPASTAFPVSWVPSSFSGKPEVDPQLKELFDAAFALLTSAAAATKAAVIALNKALPIVKDIVDMRARINESGETEENKASIPAATQNSDDSEHIEYCFYYDSSEDRYDIWEDETAGTGKK
ncbi:hypothetical protein BIW11_05541 [Tropilaelaps mercedesae]|uniref:Uncharacterized protein n=1 Tax=Tropilaelaps mercedesae TaxID=418985 RepID=A0A1V9Y1U4_9ACAR|nr:hypothetical protein BIW11_05541 [Tropilaelaps mercedesae]